MKTIKTHRNDAIGPADPIRIGETIIFDSCDLSFVRFHQRMPTSRDYITIGVKGGSINIYSDEIDFPQAITFFQASHDQAREITYPPPKCEHGIEESCYCAECNHDYKVAAADPENKVTEELPR